MATKQCNVCGRVLPLSEFYKSGNGKLRPACKDCCAKKRGATRFIPHPIVDGKRKCRTCGEVKIIDDFYYRKRIDNYETQCKSCKYKAVREREKSKRKEKPPEELVAKKKKCKDCGKFKSLSLFQKQKSTKDGLRAKCRQCRTKEAAEWRSTKPRTYSRDIMLQREMGITLEEYRREKKKRKGVCDLCGTKCGDLVADHCHKTKKFRGFICSATNTGLGKLGDDIEGLERALKYLKSADARYKKAKKGRK